MRTAAIVALLAAATTLSALPGTAVAQPVACAGRYALQGGQLDVGGGLAPFGQIMLVRGTSDGDLPSVHLGEQGVFGADTCAAVRVTRAPRADVFALRARFEGCGERPRFRLRVRFDESCEEAVVRMRAQGEVIASLTARLRRSRPGGPIVPVGPGDPVGPGAPDAPAPAEPVPPPADDTAPEADATPIGTTPSISSVSPPVAAPGETISVFGANLDRDQSGSTWVGTVAAPPYIVTFASADASFGRLRVSPTFVSPERIDVRVPAGAISGTLVLAVRRGFGAGPTIAETEERLVVVREQAPPASVPQTGTPPATANAGTLTIQETALSFFNAGAFPVTGPFQIGALLDANEDHVVNLFPAGRDDVPYLAFPVRSSEFDFAIQGGRGYFRGANAIVWVFFEGGDPAVLDASDQFFVVHLAVDLAARTARPVAMLAGVAGSPGIVMMADQFAAETSISVAQPGGGVGAISGRIAAVPLFLENVFLPSQPGLCLDDQDVCADFGPSIEQRVWANGVVIDFDVPLFADN